ncbi:MAG TPA: hypothetical protein VMH32_15800 [Burkholderiales bacterium]|nr:hypothetical protein [Burkholderiales bacterium]
MTHSTVALLLLGVFALVACHHQPKQAPLADPPQDVASGSTLTLNEALAIPAGSASVHFQDTQMVSVGALRPSNPYCMFGLPGAANAARDVGPQAFTVTGVDYDEGAVGSAGEVVTATRISLQTWDGAKGYSMTCMVPRAAANPRFVTVPEINGALGDFFTLKRVY